MNDGFKCCLDTAVVVEVLTLVSRKKTTYI